MSIIPRNVSLDVIHLFIGSFRSGNAITAGERVEVGKGLGDGPTQGLHTSQGQQYFSHVFSVHTCPQIRLSACLLEAYEARKEESRKLLIGLNC